jgi:hypothetical protein
MLEHRREARMTILVDFLNSDASHNSDCHWQWRTVMRASDFGSQRMTLLGALAFPLRLPSLLFIVVSSLILAIVTRGHSAAILMAILPVYMMLVWLTQFAFTMIDDVAHGAREPATATAEMMAPFGDARCWVHPGLAAAIALLLYRP